MLLFWSYAKSTNTLVYDFRRLAFDEALYFLQLASSLATLMGLLREAGVNLSELPSTSSTNEHTANPDEENTQEKTEFEPDEV